MSIIMDNESRDLSNNIPDEPVATTNSGVHTTNGDNDDNKSESEYGNFQEKCGEVFVQNGKYYLLCQFCSENHKNFELFIEHISSEHLVPYNESDDSADDNNCCISSSEDDAPLSKIAVKTTNNFLCKNEKNFEMNNKFPIKFNSSSHSSSLSRNTVMQQPENISCEPDTGMFYDLSDDDSQDISSNNVNEFSQMLQLSQTNGHSMSNWNGGGGGPASSSTSLLMQDNFRNQWKKEEDGRFYCEFCEKSYSYSKSLKEHIEAVHNKQEKQFKCPTCDKAFSKQWKLNTHLKVHTDERPFVCSLCVMSFKWKKNLQRHLVRVHSVKYSDLVYEMSRDESSSTFHENSFQQEYKTTASAAADPEQYPIIKNLLLTNTPAGSMAPPESPQLSMNHSIKVENNPIELSAESIINNDQFISNCFLNDFNSSSSIENQLLEFQRNNSFYENSNPQLPPPPPPPTSLVNNNSSIKSELIDEDDNTVVNNSNNNYHYIDQLINSNEASISTNNDGLYSCRSCDKVYLRKESLLAHEQIHTKAPSSSSSSGGGYMCKLCNKSFKNHYNFDRHMRSHHKHIEKPFKCHLCTTAFYDENALRKHIKRHFKKNYSCRCGQVFKVRSDYRSHRKLCKVL